MEGLHKLFDQLNFGARKNFFKNFFSLAVFQGIELLIPLITIPLIINKVGIENFGLINFALVFGIFFQLIINFGFNTISIREISINKDNYEKVSQIHSDTVSAKFVLAIICTAFATLIIFSFKIFYTHSEIYFFTLLSLIGQSLIPVWFFQGLQESKYLTISSFIGKIFYLFAILFWLNKEEDYIMVPIYSLISYLITVLIASFIIYKKYGVRHKMITFNSLNMQLKMGKYMFLSELKLFFISSFNVFVLGIVSGNTAVAYFVGAEKYLRAFSNIFMPIQNSLFPILAIKLNTNIYEAKILIKKVMGFFSVILVILCVSLFLMADQIVEFFLGSEMSESIIVFKILSFIPLLSFFDTFFGKQILLNLRKEKQFFNVVVIVAVINIPLIYFFSSYYSYVGAAISQLISQLLLLAGMAYYSFITLKSSNQIK